MKKTTLVVLCIALLASVFAAGCGSGAGSRSASDSETFYDRSK
jgi:ABC-type oligopeptide transport system substrate-binding subunit